MSKPRKMNLRDLIAADATAAQVETAVEAPEPAAKAPAEIVTLQAPAPATRPRTVPATRPAAPAKARAGEGNIKQRATQMTLYLEDPAYDQLRELAFTERTKMHPLILEAIDLLFKKRGLKSLAELQKAAS